MRTLTLVLGSGRGSGQRAKSREGGNVFSGLLSLGPLHKRGRLDGRPWWRANDARRSSILAKGVIHLGSKHFDKYRERLFDGVIPRRYADLSRLVPGRRICEVGCAEGVLPLILAREGRSALGIEMSRKRLETAFALKTKWSDMGFDVAEARFALGTWQENRHRLDSYDTLVLIRVIYYLGDEIDRHMDSIPESIETIVLGGNPSRVKEYERGDESASTVKVGEYGYYSTADGMRALLVRHGFTNVQSELTCDNEPIVIGRRT